MTSMSREVLEEILARAIEDNAFRTHLLDAPGEALEGYTLTDRERDAFIAGDLRELLMAAHLGSDAPD